MSRCKERVNEQVSVIGQGRRSPIALNIQEVLSKVGFIKQLGILAHAFSCDVNRIANHRSVSVNPSVGSSGLAVHSKSRTHWDLSRVT